MKKLIALAITLGLLSAMPIKSIAQETVKKVHVTSYRATVRECGSSRGLTASGVRVTKGVVATDWRVFPPGTVLYCISTREIWVAADKGGAIHGNDIDRFVHYWKPGLYKEGRLHVVVLYKPSHGYNRKLVHQAVVRGLYLRKCLLRQNFELASRGGRYYAKQYISSVVAKKYNKVENKHKKVYKKVYKKHIKKHIYKHRYHK